MKLLSVGRGDQMNNKARMCLSNLLWLMELLEVEDEERSRPEETLCRTYTSLLLRHGFSAVTQNYSEEQQMMDRVVVVVRGFVPYRLTAL